MTTSTPTPEEVKRIAESLSKAQRINLMKVSRRPFMTASELGVTGMGVTLLCCRVLPLVERKWAEWGPDRIHGQLRGAGYEYRLTESGIAVRAYLESTNASD